MSSFAYFISCSASDVDLAAGLQRALGEDRAFLYKRSLRAGDNWPSAIVAALRSAHTIVFVISEATINADGVLDEVARADHRRRHDSQFRIIPILYDGITIDRVPAPLGATTWIAANRDGDARIVAAQIERASNTDMNLPHIHKQWASAAAQDELFEAIRASVDGSVLIQHTWFASAETFFRRLLDALQKSSRITEVCVLLPKSGPLAHRIHYRDETISDATDSLLHTIREFALVCKLVNWSRIGKALRLTLKLYDGQAMGPFVLVGETLFVGWYPPHLTSELAPMCVVPSARLGANSLVDGWKYVWERCTRVEPAFVTKSIWASEIGAALTRVLASSMSAVNAEDVVRSRLDVDNFGIRVGDWMWRRTGGSQVHIIAIGKASRAMVRGALQALGEPPSHAVVVSKAIDAASVECQFALPEERWIEPCNGSHPDPDAASVTAALTVQRAIRRVRPGDMVLVLLSGGGSSLATLPLPGLKVERVAEIGRVLRDAGLPIDQQNLVRKKLCQLKGGGIRHQVLSQGGSLLTLAISGSGSVSFPRLGGFLLLVVEQSDEFLDRPDVIRNARRHRGSDPEGLVNATEVVVSEVERHRVHVVLQLLRERIG